LLFVIQKVVECLNQFHELVVILFFGNMLAQVVHALSFVRGHRGLTENGVYENMYPQGDTTVNLRGPDSL